MRGRQNHNLKPATYWIRSSQLDWLRSQAGGGITQSDLVRDAIDLIAAVLEGRSERQADVESYIRIRYERINSGNHHD